MSNTTQLMDLTGELQTLAYRNGRAYLTRKLLSAAQGQPLEVLDFVIKFVEQEKDTNVEIN